MNEFNTYFIWLLPVASLIKLSRFTELGTRSETTVHEKLMLLSSQMFLVGMTEGWGSTNQTPRKVTHQHVLATWLSR